jgi:hypothetical protein
MRRASRWVRTNDGVWDMGGDLLESGRPGRPRGEQHPPPGWRATIGGGRDARATDDDAIDGRSTAEPHADLARLGAMRDLRWPGHQPAALLLFAAVLLAACSAGGATAGPSATPSGPDTPVVTEPPPSAGDGTDGSGGDLPADGAKVVVPRPGQLDVHPVSIETLTATVEGRQVTIAADWWSGVEPCTILDTIVVDQDGATFAITLREGRGPEDVACIAIAELHRAFIDLGELEPGTYTVTDATDGMPVTEFTVG